MAIAFIRTFILYILIIFSVRIMGRRQVGELQPSELVITMMISNLAALPLEDRGMSLLAGLVPILALVCFEVFTSYLTENFAILRKFIGGSPQVLIIDGKLNQKVMKKLRYSIDDILEELRVNGVFDINEVDCAVAETTGELSVFKKFKYQEVQNESLESIKPKTVCPTFTVIANGKLDKTILPLIQKSEEFIERALIKEKVKMKDILFMSCDKNGQYSIIKKEN